MKTYYFLLIFFLGMSLSYGQENKTILTNSAFEEPTDSFQATVSDYPERQLEYLPVKASRVVFPSAVQSPVKENNQVPGILFEPTYTKSDAAIILLPWWKERRTDKISWIGNTLASSGINVLFIPLAYQYERAPKGVGSGNWTVSEDLERTRAAIIQSVKDVRRAATWLLKERNIHPNKLGLMGISLGGFVGALTYSVDDRFRSAVIVLAGGDYPLMMKIQTTIHRNSKDAEKVEKILKTRRKEVDSTIHLLDPITYASPDRGKRVLMINGFFDPIVPYPCALRLKSAFSAKMISLPCGHYTALAFLPYIFPKAILHFKQTLK